jgi:hypothetical protein
VSAKLRDRVSMTTLSIEVFMVRVKRDGYRREYYEFYDEVFIV